MTFPLLINLLKIRQLPAMTFLGVMNIPLQAALLHVHWVGDALRRVMLQSHLL